MPTTTSIHCPDCGARFDMGTKTVKRNPELTCPVCEEIIDGEEILRENPDDDEV